MVLGNDVESATANKKKSVGKVVYVLCVKRQLMCGHGIVRGIQVG